MKKTAKRQPKVSDYYKKIDGWLRHYEDCRACSGVPMGTIVDRITWAWHFHKISEPEFDELCNRATYLLDNAVRITL